MMALVDANYKCMYVNVGASGRSSDAEVWERCGLRGAFEENKVSIPSDVCLPFSNRQCPYVIVGDDAFPLKKIFNETIPRKRSLR